MTDGWVRVAIVGRVTEDEVTRFRTALEDAVEAGVPFRVLFDRRAMTAPTADGRAALERWEDELLPRLAGRCVGWADIFDERRAASLARAAEADHGHGDDAAGPDDEAAYPQRTFTDLTEAESWLRTLQPGPKSCT